ncbi:M48 family metallopeptidase [Loktanella sp. S4079]|uniref:M48 family metallopeptidase n=1 Tax=Loktanella sp. S4079 TaxID=579483 RepID=UPI0005FA039F|nr:M48 family metallopeptidase [Loktanella sp. S4079]KJZ19586.1 peptidase M48 [Loktanella sp. S4079]
MRFVPIVFALVMAACTPVVQDQSPAIAPIQQTPTTAKVSRARAMSNYQRAVARIEPVAENLCRQRAPSLNCNFRIIVDDRQPGVVNAYQTLDNTGRPILGFTVGLIAEARNEDEIAFVMAHETAHHIAGHIERQRQNAMVGAVLLGGLAGALGSTSPDAINNAQRIGATVGARSYSKNFELEADALGTRIAHAAGYDPLKGAQFFFRIPDPGDRFLGTHPANGDRLRTVQRVAASL